IYAYAEWVLGNNRARNLPFILTTHDPVTGTLTARNPYHLALDNMTAFLACDGENQHFTCDRSEFLGAGSSTTAPIAALSGTMLSGRTVANADPCAVIACDIEAMPDSTTPLHFVLGAANSPAEVTELAHTHLTRNFKTRLIDNKAME